MNNNYVIPSMSNDPNIIYVAFESGTPTEVYTFAGKNYKLHKIIPLNDDTTVAYIAKYRINNE